MKHAGVIFDGDDTLWETQPFYTEAKRAFYSEMSRLGFNAAEVQAMFENTDKTNVESLGFSKHRFPTSMAQTYRSFCEKHCLDFESAIEDKIRRIGYEVFSKRPVIIDGAEQVLAHLRPHYKLILATKGDTEVQQAKIDSSGLSRFFDVIFILEHKTERELRQVIETCNLDVQKSWLVGNSLKSDINPAHRVGLKAIWIPYDTWGYEEDRQPDSPDIFKSTSLQGALKILMQERA